MMYIWHVFYNVITVFLNFKIFEVQKIRSVIGGGGGGDRKKNLNYEKGSYSWKSEIEPPKKLFFRGN